MTTMKTVLYLLAVCSVFACSRKVITSNGEKIYTKGENLAGESLLDANKSRITFINSCAGCHGKSGTRMVGLSIRYKDLSDPNRYKVPYNDSLFFRFLDEDLKSDGTEANIGVIWKLSDSDKKDLLDYLKTL
jgi:hypothetical protein